MNEPMASFIDFIWNNHEYKILFIIRPLETDFIAFKCEHYAQCENAVWNRRCQWLYAYTPKCYNTCGHIYDVIHWITATSYDKCKCGFTVWVKKVLWLYRNETFIQKYSTKCSSYLYNDEPWVLCEIKTLPTVTKRPLPLLCAGISLTLCVSLWSLSCPLVCTSPKEILLESSTSWMKNKYFHERVTHVQKLTSHCFLRTG